MISYIWNNLDLKVFWQHVDVFFVIPPRSDFWSSNLPLLLFKHLNTSTHTNSSMANHDDDFTHDVFLSFRGKTRYSFTDHLYRSLLRHGINVFRDDQNLKIGNEIGPSLLHAIEASSISIVVLCRDYASSTWCLDELVKIVHCYYEMKGKIVFVVFYKVEPSDVRHQRNSYQVAMVEHEKRFGRESEKVKAWRLALNRVCALSGLHCKDDR